MSQIAFHYRALNDSGGVSRGRVTAENRGEAYRRIVASGLRPVTIRASVRTRRGRRVSIKDISHFTYQFSVLMEARIPIAEGLRSIAEQENNTALRHVLADITARIEAGSTITESFAPHRDVFGDIYCETVRAAEASGNLTEVLGHLAQMMDQQYEIRKNVRSAMMYPICVVTALTLAVLFLMIFVVPKFAEMYGSRGIQLPLLTRGLVGVADLLRVGWVYLVPGAVAAVFAWRRAMKSERFRAGVDGALHRVPHLKSMLVGLALSRFAHVFGLSLRSGLSLIDALDMAGRSSGRPLLRADTQRMRTQVNSGGRLSDVLQTCAYVPGFARRMIVAGEEAGELPKMCQVIARHYDREVGHLAKNVATIIEPVMIVGLAAIVLIISLAIFLPMWDMAAVIG
jgi:type II secretory pathway component PulF